VQFVIHESGAWCATRISFGATFIFAIYTYKNDLTENVQGTKLVLNADETNLFNTAKVESDPQHKIINIVRELKIWFQKIILY
jgi:hypothetical protein